MKKILTLIISAALIVTAVFALSGCDMKSFAGQAILESNNSKQTAADIVGEWTDSDGDSLVFNEDGTGSYFYDEAFDSYDFDGKTLTMTIDGEEYENDLRLYDKDLVIFFEGYTYDRTSGTSGELEGSWVSNDGSGYSFDFADGKFTEDGESTGTYYVDDDELILIYDEDSNYCICLIDVDGDELFCSFGWPLSQDAE